jgi:hypothetical protein
MSGDRGWHPISKADWADTDRLPVPGGWLYRTAFYTGGAPISVCTTFVPDSGKDWQAAYSTYQRVTQQEGR